ncbi:hypothetical protein GGS23DRAFT_591857 [Durotheca rogersii]|uniref:uncharacterized protein n=1 Tax=Durotheca rogersii TaxID=419775 RepID=UPI0022207B2C|nr:uncharacterized protein GGS23DRAFT_591857 [Durotheca rogersii]KAI5868057.1 hypothetical protein GGS23DRAFT_591857 [Durotheca rogersii]
MDSNKEGGCWYVGLSKLDRLVEDSLVLANTGVRAINDYGGSDTPEATRIIDSFFKPQLIQELYQIRIQFSKVRDWLKDGGPVNDRQHNEARLFCDDSWAEKKKLHDNAVDAELNGLNDLYGNPIQVMDIPGVLGDLQAKSEQLGILPNQLAVYLNLNTRSYFVDQKYGLSSIYYGFCENSEMHGMTIHWTGAGYSSLTICPSAFGQGRRWRRWEYQDLDSTLLQPVPLSKVAQNPFDPALQDIATLRPSVYVFFHELFHLVLGSESTYPDGGEFYDTGSILGAHFSQAIRNPESFVRLAIGYERTRKVPPDANGHRVEFFTGYATQGYDVLEPLPVPSAK